MQTAIPPPENWHEILAEKDRVNAALRAEIESLRFEFEKLRKLFKGSRTERFTPSSDQLSLFGDVAVASQPEPQTQTITRRVPDSKDKQQPIRKLLPAHLERETTTIIPEGIDTESAQIIGQEITEVLEYKPGKFFVNQIIRPKYKTTINVSGNVDIQVAPIPASLQPIAKSNVGPGLLAYILISKFEDNLPLYRLGKMFLRDKIDIAESTIGDWVKQGLNLLEVLYEHSVKKIKNASYLMVDESPIAVLESNKPGSTHKGYYWVYYDPVSHLIAFQYHKSRAADAPREFLEDFKGYLQTDGYAGYNQFEQSKDIIQLACLAHIRRKFHEAISNDKDRAEYVLGQIAILYGVEKKARESDLIWEERHTLRQQESRPVLDQLKTWLLENYPTVLPKSAIGQAIQYALHLWPRLENYLLDGRLEIDNNWIENKIRPLAIGRKNYLFAGSHNAAERAGMIYSFLAMCRVAEVNPTDWIQYVLGNIQNQPINKIQDLLPMNWKKATLINNSETKGT
jgi:transposase